MLPLVGFGGVICSSFRSRGGVGGCFARVCEADGAWSNIFPLLDSANVHFSLRQSPNAPTLVYIYTHTYHCVAFSCTDFVLLHSVIAIYTADESNSNGSLNASSCKRCSDG